MPNYFKIKDDVVRKKVEIEGTTIEGNGKKGTGNAAEQYVSKILKIPVENIKEITKEEYEKLEN